MMAGICMTDHILEMYLPGVMDYITRKRRKKRAEPEPKKRRKTSSDESSVIVPLDALVRGPPTDDDDDADDGETMKMSPVQQPTQSNDNYRSAIKSIYDELDTISNEELKNFLCGKKYRLEKIFKMCYKTVGCNIEKAKKMTIQLATKSNVNIELKSSSDIRLLQSSPRKDVLINMKTYFNKQSQILYQTIDEKIIDLFGAEYFELDKKILNVSRTQENIRKETQTDKDNKQCSRGKVLSLKQKDGIDFCATASKINELEKAMAEFLKTNENIVFIKKFCKELKKEILKIIDTTHNIYSSDIVKDMALYFSYNNFLSKSDQLLESNESFLIGELVIKLIGKFSNLEYNMAYLTGCLICVFREVALTLSIPSEKLRSQFDMFLVAIRRHVKCANDNLWRTWFESTKFEDWCLVLANIFMGNLLITHLNKTIICNAEKYLKKIKDERYVFGNKRTSVTSGIFEFSKEYSLNIEEPENTKIYTEPLPTSEPIKPEIAKESLVLIDTNPMVTDVVAEVTIKKSNGVEESFGFDDMNAVTETDVIEEPKQNKTVNTTMYTEPLPTPKPIIKPKTAKESLVLIDTNPIVTDVVAEVTIKKSNGVKESFGFVDMNAVTETDVIEEPKQNKTVNTTMYSEPLPTPKPIIKPKTAKESLVLIDTNPMVTDVVAEVTIKKFKGVKEPFGFVDMNAVIKTVVIEEPEQKKIHIPVPIENVKKNAKKKQKIKTKKRISKNCSILDTINTVLTNENANLKSKGVIRVRKDLFPASNFEQNMQQPHIPNNIRQHINNSNIGVQQQPCFMNNTTRPTNIGVNHFGVVTSSSQQNSQFRQFNNISVPQQPLPKSNTISPSSMPVNTVSTNGVVKSPPIYPNTINVETSARDGLSHPYHTVDNRNTQAPLLKSVLTNEVTAIPSTCSKLCFSRQDNVNVTNNLTSNPSQAPVSFPLIPHSSNSLSPNMSQQPTHNVVKKCSSLNCYNYLTVNNFNNQYIINNCRLNTNYCSALCQNILKQDWLRYQHKWC